MSTLEARTPTSATSRLALATLCVAGFLAALNFFAVSPFYADMADDLDTTVPLLGQLLTVMLLVSAGLGLFVGPLADRYGIRELLALGMGAIAVNLLGTAMAPSYLVLVPLAVVGALGDALVFGLAFALATTLFAGDARRRAIGWTMASISVAPIVGVPAITTIGGAFGWRPAIASAGILALAATWMTLVSLRSHRPQPGSRFRLRDLRESYAPIRAHAATRRLLAVTVLRAVWMLGLVTYIGAYLREELGLSTEQVGLYYMVSGVATMLGSFLAGSRLAGRSPMRVIAAANVAGGLLGALVFLSPAGWVLVLLPLTATFGIIASVTVTAQVAFESPGEAGTTMVLNSSLLNLGSAGGAFLFGVLLAMGGYEAMAIGLPVFGIAAAALVLWPGRGGQPAPG